MIIFVEARKSKDEFKGKSPTIIAYVSTKNVIYFHLYVSYYYFPKIKIASGHEPRSLLYIDTYNYKRDNYTFSRKNKRCFQDNKYHLFQQLFSLEPILTKLNDHEFYMET